MTGWPVALADVQTSLESKDLSKSRKQNTLAAKRARGSRRVSFPGVFEDCLLSRKTTGFNQRRWKEIWCCLAEAERKYLDNTGTSRLDR